MPDQNAPPLLVVELTAAQRKQVLTASGLDMSRLVAAPASYQAWGLAGAAVRAGLALPAVRSPVVLELTTDQQGTLRAYGVRASEIALDPDAVSPDFAEPWTPGAAAVPVTDRLLVTADPKAAADDHHVVLEPAADGEAVFGTGHHPTTRLCSAQLLAHLQRGDRVADVGTGSGVLALIAVRLGAATVDGFETSEQAAAAALRNIARNGLEGTVRVHGRALRPTDGPYEVVLANLLPSVILAEASLLAGRLAAGGRLIVSGFVEARRDDVERALAECTGSVVDRATLLGWGAVTVSSQ